MLIMDKHILKKWTVQGFYPAPYDNIGVMDEFISTNSVTPEITAAVPGSIYKDLTNAEIIADPFFGRNSMLCEWVENRWWRYSTRFSSDIFNKPNSRKVLCFDGVDNRAQVWLNGKKIASFEGANRPVEFDITALIDKENILNVVIESEKTENGQFVKTSVLNTQKPRYYYKWDFSLRLVNIGIYRDVYIREYETARILNCKIADNLKGDKARLFAEATVYALKDSACDVEICLNDVNGTVKKTLLKTSLKAGENVVCSSVDVDAVKRWFPNGSGEPYCYEAVVTLKENGKTIDEYRTPYGFRTIRLLQNEGATARMKKFLFEVNGKPTYIKGFNFVPVDVMKGTQGNEKVDALLLKVKESGANLLRVWGGGYIEDEFFYEKCSEYGIMVWQDFLQSSSGADSMPNNDPEYLKKLRDVSETAIKSRRNYPCLAVWCGGNELRAADNFYPSDGDCPNLKMLSDLVKTEDPDRIFYETTPLGGNFGLDKESGTNQNVHGNYKYYLGEYGIFHNKFYNDSDSLFHGECGVDGLAALDTLKTVLPQEEQKVIDGKESFVWKHFETWWQTLERSEYFFGKISNLEDYVFASQFIQAEGIRYIIDCNRRRAFYNGGTILWQLNEPSPNVSCTSVIDYYLREKQAYNAVKKAFQPVYGCLKYEKLDFDKGEQIKFGVYFINETAAQRKLRVRVIADETEVLFDEERECSSVNGRGEYLYDLAFENSFDKGLEVELTSGEYVNSVLLLSKGDRGHCDLEYVKRRKIWNVSDIREV